MLSEISEKLKHTYRSDTVHISSFRYQQFRDVKMTFTASPYQSSSPVLSKQEMSWIEFNYSSSTNENHKHKTKTNNNVSNIKNKSKSRSRKTSLMHAKMHQSTHANCIRTNVRKDEENYTCANRVNMQNRKSIKLNSKESWCTFRYLVAKRHKLFLKRNCKSFC